MSETSRLRGGEGYGVRDDVVTLRRLRDARLPCDSGSKQVCFAAPRFFVLAPVHPRCSARLRASYSATCSMPWPRMVRTCPSARE